MGGGATSRRGGIIQGINVTPLVDITLVLMIVFIVTAKIMVTPAVPLDLPEATQSEDLQNVFAVSVEEDGSLRLDGEPISDDALAHAAHDALAADEELRAVIQADGDVRHRRVIAVLDALKAQGVTRVAFGTVAAEPETQPEASEGTKAEP